jgi:hypothetical protein
MLQQLIEAYIMQIKTIPIIKDMANMQRDAQKRHEEVLNMIESLSDTTSSDRASSVQKLHYLCRFVLTTVQIGTVYSGSNNRYWVLTISIR